MTDRNVPPLAARLPPPRHAPPPLARRNEAKQERAGGDDAGSVPRPMTQELRADRKR